MATFWDLKPGLRVTWKNEQQLVIDAYVRSHRGNLFLLTQGCTFALDVSNKYFFRIAPWAPYITIQLEDISV
jgi:hypothetical protein